MVMYGSPVWAKSITKKEEAILNSMQRPMALRIARAFRTTPTAMLFVLAGTLPYKWLAKAWGNVCSRTEEIKRTGRMLSNQQKESIRAQEMKLAMESWRKELEEDGKKKKPFLKIIIKKWDEWQQNGPPTYRVVQLTTGHGCFAEYLKKIGAIRLNTCQECSMEVDNSDHTLFRCSAFNNQRGNIRIKIGDRLNHETFIEAIMDGKEKGEAVIEYAEEVMKIKEQRDREDERREN